MYSTCRVAELKAELKKRGASVRGKKADLVKSKKYLFSSAGKNEQCCAGKISLLWRSHTMIPIPAKFYCTRKFKKVTHCLFDLDGTVLDSEVVYHKAIRIICEKYGKVYTKDMEVQCYGATDRELAEMVVQRALLPISVDDFEHQLADMIGKSVASAPIQPGAERLLIHLYDSKIPTALATNSTEAAVRLHAAARPKLFALFNHKVCATDPEVDRGKPNPDLYLVAASRFPSKPKPAECIVFEDSEVGVKAGIAAGMQVVMIPDKRLDRERTRQATIVLRSLRDFKPEEFGLPPFPEIPTKGKPTTPHAESEKTHDQDIDHTRKNKLLTTVEGTLMSKHLKSSKPSKIQDMKAQLSIVIEKTRKVSKEKSSTKHITQSNAIMSSLLTHSRIS